jgi:hypothetical protein
MGFLNQSEAVLFLETKAKRFFFGNRSEAVLFGKKNQKTFKCAARRAFARRPVLYPLSIENGFGGR